jgi:hypothetical protein
MVVMRAGLRVGRRAPALVLVALLSGCGAGDPPRPPSACTASAEAIERALHRAPATVTLEGGARLSDCVARARSDADLQNTGLVLTRAADHLAEPAQHGDARAAAALGYLVGATRRGAARTTGIQEQLKRRVEQAAAFLDGGGPDVAAALARGIRAGEATG